MGEDGLAPRSAPPGAARGADPRGQGQGVLMGEEEQAASRLIRSSENVGDGFAP